MEIPMNIHTVGVVGAGVMGAGIAQNLAQTDHHVILVDLTDEILDRSRSAIQRSLRFQGLFNKAAAPTRDPLEKITFTTDIMFLNKAGFVIESVSEKWEIKEAIFRQLDSVCNPNCVFASNTSAISITRIASTTRRPEKVVGTHFMNPVPMKKAVEVIRGFHTSEETLERTGALLTRMEKKYIVVNDAPGFVTNRVLMLTINEAIFVLQDNVASAQDIDYIFKSCFEHKMGPLETADLIGLDTILLSLEVLYYSYKDPKYRPSPLLQRMVDAGLYGRKNGKGFYSYPDLEEQEHR
jgi:3-hydroxybutyryl-CoA dehydrogenase